MARGNQRELARQKAMKKQQEQNRMKGAETKGGNKGLTLEERKHRDAELMRLKQKKAEEKKQNRGESSEKK